MSLTKRSIDALRYDNKGKPVQIIWDGSLKGFGARVYPSGAKAFLIDYRTEHGTKKRLTIGRYPAVTVEQARKKTMSLLAAVNNGEDPAEDRRQKRNALLVRELADTYIDRHAKRRKRTWAEDERRLKKYVRPAFGSKSIVEVTRADVSRLHDKIGHTAKVEANRVLALVSVMFTLAEEWGFLPGGHVNPAKRVKPFAEHSRDRWVTHAEFPRLWSAIQSEESPYARAFFVLALLLGCRRSELLQAKWKNVDLTRRELRLPNTKAGNTHTLPLSERAAGVLFGLPQMLGNPHVFPSSVQPKAPMRDVKRQWRRIRKEAGLEDVRLHDLRRTVGSWLATSGASLPLIGKVLNHADASTTAIYARLAEDAARSALDQHAERIFSVGGAQP